MLKLKAQELRTTVPSKEDLKKIKKNPIYIVLDNVMDTYNIGSIFRLADSVAAEKIILCGETEAPPHTRIKKASINTTEWVNWEYAETAASAISNLKSQISNIQIVAVEQDTKSVQYDKVDYTFPVALVVGHETHGVSKSALQLCDNIAEIPMWGVNVSLNVVVSLGIVLFKVMEKI
jgi:tRNA G18 (ribose-2'-O)-methylase SpoU